MAARIVERRIVTVLFADLVGFTSLSERLDAEDVSLVQDAYFESVRETIERHGGLLEKFVGDAAMAVFGAPRVRDDDAERAVRAGLALVAAITRIGSTLGLEEGALRLRVGVNTGEAIYGEATVDRGPVTGDTVNVAARLQSAAAPNTVVVGELTSLAVADSVELEPAGPLELKGKAEGVPAWRVVSVYPERSRERALGALAAPMVGRDEELAQLLAPLGDGAKRIAVVAPPGVGKTRLLQELAAEAARRGAAVFIARLRPDLLSPFEPVGQLVRSVGDPSDVVGRLAPGRGEVVRDALAAVIAPVEALTSFREERDRLFAAWVEGLDALADGKPAVWLVEDLHWASGDLLAFLHVCGSDESAQGRLIVGTARPALLESAADWCAGGDVLDLEPLPREETATLLHALIGDVLPPALVDRIAERSGGNPLFVEELLRTWIATGLLKQAGDAWTLGAESDDVTLPATVQAIYAGQLDDLPAAARTAARRAAVAGRRFPFAALEPLQVSDAAEAVATLHRRALVGPGATDPVLGESYVFRHALLRDTGYASLARGERALLHLRLAEWLEDFPEAARPTLAEVIARHYAAAFESAPSLARDIGGRARADVREAAAAWFERAAEIAARFAAWESARALALRSLELSEGEPPLTRARRLMALADPTANTTGVSDAETILREALDLYRAGRVDDESVACAGLSAAGAAIGELMHAQTRFELSGELANALLREIGRPDDASTGRLLLIRASAVVSAWDDYDTAEADVTRALELARAHGDWMLELDALGLGARILGERGDERAAAAWEQVESLSRRAGRWDKVVAAIRVRGGLARDDEEALRLFDLAAEISDAHGLVENGAWCHYARAETYFESGRWDEATDSALAAVEIAERHGFDRVAVRSWFVLLPLARARGRDDLVGRGARFFHARMPNPPESPYARVVATAAHLHFAACGFEPDFVPDVDSRLGSFDLDHEGPSWLAAVETLIGRWLDGGQADGAEVALERMRASLDAHRPTPLARATEALLRARLLLFRGQLTDAVAEAERALVLLESRAPWWRAKAIRILEQGGAANARQLEEARTVEARLGIPVTLAAA
ncbi:MAG: hypothetical protein QOE13_924 [Gaiellaceae bacterium]|nr:hypothetical protein [Gaiellaceae bacterium]